MRVLTNSNPAGDPHPHYQQEDPFFDLPAIQPSPTAMRNDQPRTRRGWSTPGAFLLLALSLCRLPHASSSDFFSASDSRRLQPAVCSCAPMEYMFKLDLSLNCLEVNLNMSNPGIQDHDCSVRSFDGTLVTDSVPVEITDIQVLELRADFTAITSLVVLNLDADNGVSDFEFQFTSTLSEQGLDTIPADIPRGLQVILTGRTVTGQTITNYWAVQYNLNNCNTAPIYTPQTPNTVPSIGWLELVDATPPLSGFCRSTAMPTLEPTAVLTPEPSSRRTPEPTLEPTPGRTPVPTPGSTLEPTAGIIIEPTAGPIPMTPDPTEIATEDVPSTPTPTPRSSVRPEHSAIPTPSATRKGSKSNQSSSSSSGSSSSSSRSRSSSE